MPQPSGNESAGRSALSRLPFVASIACAGVLAGCGGDAEVEQGAVVYIFGPPQGQFADLDPFKDCDFVKLCYLYADSFKPFACRIAEYDKREVTIQPIPFGDEVTLAAECLRSDPAANPPAPLENAVSHGKTCPIRHESDEEAEEASIYMLPAGQFGPTVAAPYLDLAEQTKPNEPRVGATVTELFDGTVLIAGGATQLMPVCQDWSDPTCVAKASIIAETYDPRAGSFNLVGTQISQMMTEKRAFAAAAALPDGSVAIFGGIRDGGEVTNTVVIFDPYTGTFASGPPMASARASHTATLVSDAQQGFVLLVGGFGSGEGTWEIWTPGDGTVAEGSLAQSRWNHTATRVKPSEDAGARDMVVIAGGEGGGSPGSTVVRDSVEIFDVANQAMDPSPLVLCDNDGDDPAKKTLHAAAYVPKRHFIYMAGGFDDAKHSNPLRDICVFSTSKERWDAEKGHFFMALGRGGLTATPLPGNLVLLVGGITRTKETSPLTAANSVEVILEFKDVSGSTMIEVGPQEGFAIAMMYPRWRHNAIKSCDGKVLIVGGLTGSPGEPSLVEHSEVFNSQ